MMDTPSTDHLWTAWLANRSDESASDLITHLYRSGLISDQDVEIAAYLGFTAARLHFPGIHPRQRRSLRKWFLGLAELEEVIGALGTCRVLTAGSCKAVSFALPRWKELEFNCERVEEVLDACTTWALGESASPRSRIPQATGRDYDEGDRDPAVRLGLRLSEVGALCSEVGPTDLALVAMRVVEGVRDDSKGVIPRASDAVQRHLKESLLDWTLDSERKRVGLPEV